MKNLVILFAFLLVLAPQGSIASMPNVYPIFGYNEDDNLCQIKQLNTESDVNEDLQGEYWNLRECRFSNPQIILNTGLGILIWLVLLTSIFVKNFFILNKVALQKKTDKRIDVLWDSFLILVLLSVIVLISHYFSVPITYYHYGSDIDQIFYSYFIDSRIPIIVTILYMVYSFVSLAVFYQQNKKQ